MSELENCVKRIDRFLSGNDLKAAQNYVNQLKANGMGASRVSYLQVYISKNMEQLKKDQKICLKDYILSSRPKNDPSPSHNIDQKQQESSSTQINSKRVVSQGYVNVVDPNQRATRQPMNYGKFFHRNEEQVWKTEPILEISNKQGVSSTGSGSKSFFVKLPSLNKMESEQYSSLKQIIQTGINELSDRLDHNQLKSNALVDSALHFSSSRRLDKAIDQFDKAISLDQSNLRAIIAKADCLRKYSKFEASIQCYDNASRMHPPVKTQFQIQFNKANVLKCQGKSKEAIESYSKAVLLEPNNPNPYFNKALTYYTLGEIENAIDSYSSALKVDPTDRHCLLNQGLALREVGEFSLAINCFKQAALQKASNAREYLNKGNAYFQVHKLQESLECYQRAVKLDPKLFQGYLNMGVVLNELGRTQEEIDCYERVLSIQPKNMKALFNMGIAQREQGNMESSIKSFNELIEIDNSFIDAFINKGLSLSASCQYEESIQCFKQALEIDKSSLSVYFNMGNTLRVMRKPHRAIKIYHQAIGLHPLNAELRCHVGDTQMEKLNIKKSLQAYSQALELNPIEADALTQKGVCLVLLNETELAAKIFNQSALIDNLHPNPLIFRAHLALLQGHLKNSIITYQAAAERIQKMALISSQNLKINYPSQEYILLCKAHALRFKANQTQAGLSIQILNELLQQNINQFFPRFSIYLELCAHAVGEIMRIRQEAQSKISIVVPKNQFYEKKEDGKNINVNTNQVIPAAIVGNDIEDAYFHLFCYIACEVETLTRFNNYQIDQIKEKQSSDPLYGFLMQYLSLKRKQGEGSLGMGNGKHTVFMSLSYIYIALILRQKKEYDESMLYFNFLMHLDHELQTFSRFQGFISYLLSSHFTSLSKKFPCSLFKLIAKGTTSEVYQIILDKEQPSNGQETPQKPLEQYQNIGNKEIIEQFEKELVCRKITAVSFKSNREKHLREFAFQNILSHRNIQKINYLYTDGEENGCFVEPRQRCSLITYLEENIVTFDQRLHILLQVAQAIEYLHNNRILHGGITAKNILIRDSDCTPLLTDFSNARILLKSYHFGLDFQKTNTKYLSQNNSSPQINLSNCMIEFDLKMTLSEDILAFGQLFSALLLKMLPNDRIINNWHRKGFGISFQIQKLIRSMLEPIKPYKRPDIQTILQSIQFEIFTLSLYDNYFVASNVGSQDRISQSRIPSRQNQVTDVLQDLPMTPMLQSRQQRNHQNQSDLAKIVYNQEINKMINSNEDIIEGTPLRRIRVALQYNKSSDEHSIQDLNSSLNMNSSSAHKRTESGGEVGSESANPSQQGKRTTKKVMKYQLYAQELDEIRHHYKMGVLYKITSLSEVNEQLKQKINCNLRFNYIRIEELLSNEIFISALNFQNMNLMVLIIKQIQDCSQSDLLSLLKRFYSESETLSRRMELENIYQLAQARLLYRIVGRSDPDKYYVKLMQKSQFRDVYLDIAQIYLSDNVESIENKLRPILLELFSQHAFADLKRNLLNFSFSSSLSNQKRKAIIIENFLQITAAMQLPFNEVEKIIKDPVINSKLLQIIKFDGYLIDLCSGVYELLFLPLRETIDKQFKYSKTQQTSLSDHPLVPIINAKLFFKQKLKLFLLKEKNSGWKMSSTKKGANSLYVRVKDTHEGQGIASTESIETRGDTKRSQVFSQINILKGISSSPKVRSQHNLGFSTEEFDLMNGQSLQKLSQKVFHKKSTIIIPQEVMETKQQNEEQCGLKQAVQGIKNKNEPLVLPIDIGIKINTNSIAHIVLEEANTQLIQFKKHQKNPNNSTIPTEYFIPPSEVSERSRKRLANDLERSNSILRASNGVTSNSNIQDNAISPQLNLSVYQDESKKFNIKKAGYFKAAIGGPIVIKEQFQLELPQPMRDFPINVLKERTSKESTQIIRGSPLFNLESVTSPTALNQVEENQGVEILINVMDLVEEDNYNIFIWNHIKNNFFGGKQTSSMNTQMLEYFMIYVNNPEEEDNTKGSQVIVKQLPQPSSKSVAIFKSTKLKLNALKMFKASSHSHSKDSPDPLKKSSNILLGNTIIEGTSKIDQSGSKDKDELQSLNPVPELPEHDYSAYLEINKYFLLQNRALFSYQSVSKRISSLKLEELCEIFEQTIEF